MTQLGDLGGGDRGAKTARVSLAAKIEMASESEFPEASTTIGERRNTFEWIADGSLVSQQDIEQDRTLSVL